MFPTLFTIGNFQVSSYYFFYILGGTVGAVLGWRLASSMGYGTRRILAYFSMVFPLAILAGLLNGVLFNLMFYQALQYGQILLEGGIVSYGVVLAVYAVTAGFSRHYHTPTAGDLDGAALILPVMLAIFRIGCLLNGCCYGRVTSDFGGVYLPNIYGEWALRYPTQLLLFGLDVALAAGLWLRRKHAAPGDLAVAFIFWFGLGRLAIDSLRNLPPVLGPLGLHQLTDLLFLLVGAGLMIARRVKRIPAPSAG